MGEIVWNYQYAHVQLRKQRGKASSYACVECGKPAKDWALRHDVPQQLCPIQNLTYTLDVQGYQPMCRSCHNTYDMSVITHCPKGHEYTEENTYTVKRPRSGTEVRTCRQCRRDAEKRRKPRDQREYLREYRAAKRAARSM